MTILQRKRTKESTLNFVILKLTRKILTSRRLMKDFRDCSRCWNRIINKLLLDYRDAPPSDPVYPTLDLWLRTTCRLPMNSSLILMPRHHSCLLSSLYSTLILSSAIPHRVWPLCSIDPLSVPWSTWGNYRCSTLWGIPAFPPYPCQHCLLCFLQEFYSRLPMPAM